jgi:ATP synthase protein I
MRESSVTQPEPRSNLAVGIQWASRVMSLGLEFALPPLAGVFLDRRWHLAPLATISGAVLGFVMGMMHVLRIARERSGP